MDRPSGLNAAALWGCCSGLLLGALVVGYGGTVLAPLFFGIAIGTVLLVMWLMAHRWGDPFNPLTVLLALGLFRFTVPAVVVALSPDSLRTPIYRQMRLTGHDITLGHVLALMALLAACLPWVVGHQGPTALHHAEERSAARRTHGAVVVALLGFGAWWYFVQGNGASPAVLLSGAFRSLEVREGTGVYFYLGLFLISGAVFLTSSLAARSERALVCLAPSFVASGAYFLLGGRARALTPLAAAALILWWRRLRQGRPRLGLRGFALALVGVWFFSVGIQFRGGAGLDALTSNVLSPAQMRQSLLVDQGQIHGMAGVAKAPAGITGGGVLASGALWPITEVAPINAPSPGVFIVRYSAGNIFKNNRTWGLLPTAGGEGYLDFGMVGVVVVCGAGGWALKRVYLWGRTRRFSDVVCALATVYLVRVFFESTGKLSEMWVVLVGVAAVNVTARLLMGPEFVRSPRMVRSEQTARSAMPRPRRGLQ